MCVYEYMCMCVRVCVSLYVFLCADSVIDRPIDNYRHTEKQTDRDILKQEPLLNRKNKNNNSSEKTLKDPKKSKNE